MWTCLMVVVAYAWNKNGGVVGCQIDNLPPWAVVVVAVVIL